MERDTVVWIYDYDRVGPKSKVFAAGTIFQPWGPSTADGSDVPITIGDQAEEFDWGTKSWDGHFLGADDFFANCMPLVLDDAGESLTIDSNEYRIFRELTALLYNHEVNGSVVLIEEPQSEKFIQFGPGSTLEIDVPHITLSDEEADGAYRFFQKLSDEYLMEYDAPDPIERVVRHGATFNHDFGRDAKLATKTAIALFQQVFQIRPDAPLRIKRLY